METLSLKAAGRRTHAQGPYLALLCAAAVAACGCTQANSSASIGASSSALPEEPAASSTEPAPGPDRLLALGGRTGGPYSLWLWDTGSGWDEMADAGTATAIGRDGQDLFLAGQDGVEVTALSEFLAAAGNGTQEWHLQALGAQVGSVSRSPQGRVAVVTVGDSGATYLLEDGSGQPQPLTPAPRQAFSPVVGWIEGEQLLVLTVDAQLVPHLGVVDPASATETMLTSVTGVRVFCVSPDYGTVAVATEDAVYVAAVPVWLADEPLERAFDIPAGHVAWGLALDTSGRRLAMLVGRVEADGSISEVRDVLYSRTASSWTKAAEFGLPFEAAAGQLWLDQG
jgi:hypothetical protein